MYVRGPIYVLFQRSLRSLSFPFDNAKIQLFQATGKMGVWLMCENLLRNGRIWENFADGEFMR